MATKKGIFQDHEGNELTPKALSDHLADTARHIVTLTHSKEGSTHTLTGLSEAPGIYTAQFKATADYAEGDTFSRRLGSQAYRGGNLLAGQGVRRR